MLHSVGIVTQGCRIVGKDGPTGLPLWHTLDAFSDRFRMNNANGLNSGGHSLNLKLRPGHASLFFSLVAGSHERA